MNRINLLKKTSKKQPVAKTRHIPSWIFAVVGAVVLVPAIIMLSLKYIPRTKTVPPPVVKTEPSPFTPSTYTNKSSIVEEVVREVNSERSSADRLDISYNELSFIEKVNYEVLFAKNVFSLFSRAVPAGIGLKSLEIDNFQTLYAVGLGNTRELISSTFIALKSEKVELLPQPFSYITTNDGDGYRFVVTCKINSGLDRTDPFMASDALPSKDDLPILTKKIVTLGEQDSVFFSSPVQIDAERVGAYHRFHYTYKGTTTYNNFVKLLLSLYENKIPCAFKKVTIKARSGAAVDIDAQVLFTVRE